MMARQNPRTGTKIEKRTRTGIVAGTVTETEGETGIGIGTRIETETEIEIGIGIAKVGITVKEGNRETVRMITEAVILKGEEIVIEMGIAGIVLAHGLVQGAEIGDHVQEAKELVDLMHHPHKQWVQHFQLFQRQKATMYGNKAILGHLPHCCQWNELPTVALMYGGGISSPV